MRRFQELMKEKNNNPCMGKFTGTAFKNACRLIALERALQSASVAPGEPKPPSPSPGAER